MPALVTVLGGDGFIGRYAVRALLKDGWRVRIASRRPKRSYHLKSQANLGQIGWAVASVNDRESLAEAMAGADAVINLVGSFSNMDAVHVSGGRNVASAAAAAGVAAFVHLSAIGADPGSQSTYGRTKGEGELAVRDAFPAATILRPSIVFGREDQFINRFAGLIRLLPIVPVIGGATRFQPVFAGDVGRAIVSALASSNAGGTYELGGPDVLTMLELNRWIAAKIGREKPIIEVPDTLAAGMARATGWLPFAPISWDQWLMLQKDNVVADGAPGLSDLGIAPVSLEVAAEGWLVKYRRYGRFGSERMA